MPGEAQAGRPKPRWVVVGAMALLVIAGGGLAWFQPWVPREEPASIERMAFPLPEKPSIAVLPLDNLSGDPKQEFFSDGITEDIITRLSQFPHLFVIARHSSFTYKNKPVKVQQVAEELGVRYVLEGSVQRTDAELRITGPSSLGRALRRIARGVARRARPGRSIDRHHARQPGGPARQSGSSQNSA